jgi:molybdate transport system substrate-binding protein
MGLRNVMKNAIASVVAWLAVAMLITSPVAAQTDIKVLCSNGFKAVLEELAPQFERATNQKVAIRYGLAAQLKQQIEAGEAFDLAILTPAAIDDLIKAHKVVPDSRTVLARSGLGIAIRAGARTPSSGRSSRRNRSPTRRKAPVAWRSQRSSSAWGSPTSSKPRVS